MTTACLPCEMAATAEAVPDEEAPEIEPGNAARWSGPIGIEAQRTGDGRLIEANALRWDTLPIPLRWAMQDFGAHDGAYVVGKIETIERLTYEETNERLAADGRDALPESFADVIVIWGEGSHDMGSEYGREAHRQCKEGLTPGISMDLDDIVIREEEGDSFTIGEGRVRAATQVAIPAFEGARIAVSDAGKAVFDAGERLGDLDALVEEGAFNWVEDAGGLPKYIKRIQKHLEKKGMEESHAIATAVNVVKKMCATGDVNFPGAQEVNAASRAEACAAVAEWEEKKATHAADEPEALVASANGWKPRAAWFQDPMLDEPTGIVVTEDGRVYGHIALWGTCHIASPQGKHVCTQPPSSPSNYRNFHLGSTLTDEGLLATGKITMNTVHAGQRLSMVDTLHHYEHTGTVGAHVRAGEDRHGIWVAGAALPDADLVALRAAPISGDWRSPSGALDLVAALSVNVPGFPVPRAQALVAGGAVVSLVASGVVEREERHEAVTLDLSDATAVMALRERFKEMDRADKAAALAAKVARLAALEAVRRVSSTIPFAYNEDQWRVPKGNPEGGRWIDMPDLAVDDLAAALGDFGESSSLNPGELDSIGQRIEAAQEGAKQAADALKANDGAEAQVGAAKADAALSALEAQLQDHADNGEIPEEQAGAIGEKLDAARNAVSTVKDSDLSLLGDEGIGGDAPEGDIGAGDEAVVGDADPVEAAQGAADDLESTMMSLFDSVPADADAADDIGRSLAEAVDAAHGSDPAASDKALDDLERKLQGYIDGGQVDLSDEDANALGERIDALREANKGLDPEGSAAEPPGPSDADAPDPEDAPPPPEDTQDAPPAPPVDSEPGGKAGENGNPPGSPVQQAANKAEATGSRLEAVLQDAADGGWDADPDEFNRIGETLDTFREALADLKRQINSGGSTDPAAAQSALAALESMLMSSADGPEMPDAVANQIGMALDDAFADLADLVAKMQGGSTEPPPFSARKYARQWLGRRGIALAMRG